MFLTTKDLPKRKDYTYVKHPEGVVEGGVTRQNTGGDFIAP